MPIRPVSRDQTWLLPPTVDDLVSQAHPARFVVAFLEELDRSAWAEMGIGVEGDAQGAPAYDPVALAAVWVYGFMTGIRSSRKLEAACRDQLPFLWVTGWQFPDHNTLWRFYQAHREGMRKLLKFSVRTAVEAGLVDLAVQAVDGTKIAGNASRDRTYDQVHLEQLLQRTEAAVKELEAQNATGGDEPPPSLPKKLQDKQALREQVKEALDRLLAQPSPAQTNLTDKDAALMKSRTAGYVIGYNAQAMVAPVDADRAGQTGLLITAADVTSDADDHRQLAPMIEQARQITGKTTAVTLADAGYHSGPNLAACADLDQTVVMPEAQEKALKDPYHKAAFRYDAQTDTFACPEGQKLSFVRVNRRRRRPVARIYRAAEGICAACPAFQACAKGQAHGRTIETGPEEEHLRKHRAWMATAKAKDLYRRRKTLPEPVFGLLKELQGARRLLLRGLTAVRAEWALLATAFNLRTLFRFWSIQGGVSPLTGRALSRAPRC